MGGIRPRKKADFFSGHLLESVKSDSARSRFQPLYEVHLLALVQDCRAELDAVGPLLVAALTVGGLSHRFGNGDRERRLPGGRGPI